MRKAVLVSLVFALVMYGSRGVGVCSPGKLKGLEVHGEPEGAAKGAIRKGMIPILKEQKLANYPKVTIGKAFDDYEHFRKREWKETPSNNGKVFVDCTGWFENISFSLSDIKNGIRKRGVEVKFVIYPGGEYAVVMITKLVMDKDGAISRSPLDNTKPVLDAIYANKPISY
jgi:hypothetical protein